MTDAPNKVDVILTVKRNHTRGCKVRLISGEDGRAQQTVGPRQHVAADMPDELRGLWDQESGTRQDSIGRCRRTDTTQ